MDAASAIPSRSVVGAFARREHRPRRSAPIGQANWRERGHLHGPLALGVALRPSRLVAFAAPSALPPSSSAERTQHFPGPWPLVVHVEPALRPVLRRLRRVLLRIPG
eukprot:scaffold76379_cov28-Tisochrysis_lutea.AAC.2